MERLKSDLCVNFGQFPCSWIRFRIPIRIRILIKENKINMDPQLIFSHFILGSVMVRYVCCAGTGHCEFLLVNLTVSYSVNNKVVDQHLFNADPDSAFHFYADPDPAPLLSDGNLRPLVYWPSRALFYSPGPHCERSWPSMALL